MDRQLDGRLDKVQKMYGLEAFDKDILLLFSGHLHFSLPAAQESSSPLSL